MLNITPMWPWDRFALYESESSAGSSILYKKRGGHGSTSCMNQTAGVYCINFKAIWQYVCPVWKWTISWFIYTVQGKGWSWYNQLHESDCSVFTVSMIIMNKPRDHWSLSPPLPVIYIVYRMLGGRGGWGLFRISGGLSCVRVVRGVLYIKTNLKLVYRKFCY